VGRSTNTCHKRVVWGQRVCAFRFDTAFRNFTYFSFLHRPFFFKKRLRFTSAHASLSVYFTAHGETQFIINQTKTNKQTKKKRKTLNQTAFHHAFIRRKQKRETKKLKTNKNYEKPKEKT